MQQPRTEASILHADLDAFYASVEQRDRPELRNRPVLVGGGVVLACSYEAKARGVRTAMNSRQARELCPDAVVVEPRMSAYSMASARVFEIFDETSPLVEGLSIDEAFLDVAGLRRLVGEPKIVACRLRKRVLDEVGLAITVGVARTKFLAKVASGVAKPDGLLVVEPNRELEFLRPLAVGQLWGVGPVTADKLHHKGITTVGEVARLHVCALVAILGSGPGHHLHALAHNRDPRPIQRRRRRRSIGSQRALGRRDRSLGDLQATVLSLVDRSARRLRSGNRVARTVTLRFRYFDFERATRSFTLPEGTDSDESLHNACRSLLIAHWPVIETRGISLLGLSLSNLDDADVVQLTLPFARGDGRVVDKALRDAVLDEVRDKFGSDFIKPAALLGQVHRPLPQLPDPGARSS